MEAKHPKYVMQENVKGLLSKSMRNIFGWDLAGDLYRIIEKMGVLDLDSSPSWYLAKYLQELLMDIFAIARNNRIDLKEQIKLKMEYNETRPYLHGYKY